jgi:hypothetical protein
MDLMEGLDGPAVSALRRAIVEFKQRWSVNGWMTKNLLSRALPCFGRHVKPLVSAPTNTHWARVVGYDPFSEDLCLSSGDINRLMMMMTTGYDKYLNIHYLNNI